ncbi:hypothetical protein VE03_00312 [Pseudogymnoascus sp. 23342-1-I1]|nr:hypothetical protein VE03_00312 [Pseudogymnoascus sp. 23342-1-I1]
MVPRYLRGSGYFQSEKSTSAQGFAITVSALPQSHAALVAHSIQASCSGPMADVPILPVKWSREREKGFAEGTPAVAEYKGIYFWSLLITTVVGVLVHSVGYLIKDFNLTTATWVPVTITTIGWWTMIIGQSFVLYSRLHFVVWDKRILRFILAMIIANIFLLLVPTTVLTYGSNFSSSDKFLRGYIIMEKIEIIGVSVQEIIISGLYIYGTIQILKLNPVGENRHLVLQLLGINLIFILMDIGLIATQYSNLFTYQTTLKGLIYSIKLKLEFAVLGKLVHIVNRHSSKPDSNPEDVSDFVDTSRMTSDVTHASAAPVRNYQQPAHMRPEDVSIAMFEHSDRNHNIPDEDPSVSSSSSGSGT